jgi:hypothetical protein
MLLLLPIQMTKINNIKPLSASEPSQQDRKKPISRVGKSPVSEHKSRSHSSLPDWIKPIYYTRIYPTLIEFYGSLLNPAKFTNETRVGNQIVVVINKALPDIRYTLSDVKMDDKPYQLHQEKKITI